MSLIFKPTPPRSRLLKNLKVGETIVFLGVASDVNKRLWRYLQGDKNHQYESRGMLLTDPKTLVTHKVVLVKKLRKENV